MSIDDFENDILEKLRRKSRLFGSKMELVAGSYARAAGLQSEISKVTVTRVAGSEVHYQRCLNSYRKDLYVNINNINHEQRKLRKTMRRYSDAKRRNRREKEKRKQAELLAARLAARLAVDTLIILREDESIFNNEDPEPVENPDDKVDEDKGALDEQSGSEDVEDTENGNISIQGPFSAIGPLASISETGEKETDDEQEVDREAAEEETAPIKETAPKNTARAPPPRENTLILPPIVVKARRKAAVSYSDLIKLQHCSSTKKLISLVDKMSRQHGPSLSEIQELQRLRNRPPDTRDNVFFKGGHGEVYTQENNSLMRTAAVIYPIKYGYSSQPRGDDLMPPVDGEPTPLTLHDDSDWGNVGSSMLGKDNISTRPRRGSRTNGNSNFSTYVQEVRSRQFMNSQHTGSRESLGNSGTTSRLSSTSSKRYLTGLYASVSRTGMKLPSIEGGRAIAQTEASSRTWQSAFQKLKFVHALSGDSDIF